MARRIGGHNKNQSKISVQNIFDIGSKAGTSMQNEEMRRLQFSLEGAVGAVPLPSQIDQRNPTPTVGDGGVGPGDGDGDLAKEWALTIFQKQMASPKASANTFQEPENIVFKKKRMQGLLFEDQQDFEEYALGIFSVPIVWTIDSENLAADCKTVGDATRAVIKAYAQVPTYTFAANVRGEKSIARKIFTYNRRNLNTGEKETHNYTELTFVNDIEVAPPDYYYGTSVDGIKGWFPLPSGGGSTAGVLELEFTFAEIAAGSAFIGELPAGVTIQKSTIEVTTAFDNNVNFNIGIAVANGIVMAASFSNASYIDKYSHDPDLKFATLEDINIYQSGGVATVGEAKIIIFYQ